MLHPAVDQFSAMSNRGSTHIRTGSRKHLSRRIMAERFLNETAPIERGRGREMVWRKTHMLRRDNMSASFVDQGL